MKIVLVRTPGGPEQLDYIDVPKPEPGPGEVLIRAYAFGVGQPDALIRKGVYKWMPPLPANPGNDLAGVIEQIGAGTDPGWLGRRVLLSARDLPRRGGCYSEYRSVAADVVHPLPDSVSFETAVCLANYSVAWSLLHECGGSRPSRSVLVVGAAGGVGSAAIQLAKQAGLLTVGTVSTEAKRQFALEMGADHVINRRTEDVARGVRDATGGAGVDLVLDHVGGPGLADYLGLIATWGTLVSYGTMGGSASADLLAALRSHAAKNLAVRCFSIHAYDHDAAGRRRIVGNLLALAAEGAIRPPVFTRFALREVRQAHELLDRGEALGRIVMVP